MTAERDDDDDDVIAALARRTAPTQAELDRLAARLKLALSESEYGTVADDKHTTTDVPSTPYRAAPNGAAAKGLPADARDRPDGSRRPVDEAPPPDRKAESRGRIDGAPAPEARTSGSTDRLASVARPRPSEARASSLGPSESPPRPANRPWAALAVAAAVVVASMSALWPDPQPEERLRGAGGEGAVRSAEVDELALEVERVRDGRPERWTGEQLATGDTVVFRARSLVSGVVAVRAESGTQVEEITLAELPAGRMVDVRRGAERPGFQFDRPGLWRLVASLDGPVCSPRRCVVVEVEVR